MSDSEFDSRKKLSAIFCLKTATDSDSIYFVPEFRYLNELGGLIMLSLRSAVMIGFVSCFVMSARSAIAADGEDTINFDKTHYNYGENIIIAGTSKKPGSYILVRLVWYDEISDAYSTVDYDVLTSYGQSGGGEVFDGHISANQYNSENNHGRYILFWKFFDSYADYANDNFRETGFKNISVGDY